MIEAGAGGEGEGDPGEATTASGSRRYPAGSAGNYSAQKKRLPEVAVGDVPQLIKAWQDFLVDIIWELKQEANQKLRSKTRRFSSRAIERQLEINAGFLELIEKALSVTKTLC
jgi:hypothetical protein